MPGFRRSISPDARVPPQHEIGNAVIAAVSQGSAAAQVHVFEAVEMTHHDVGIDAVKARAVADLNDVRRRIGKFVQLPEYDRALKPVQQIELGALDDTGTQRERAHALGDDDDRQREKHGPKIENK